MKKIVLALIAASAVPFATADTGSVGAKISTLGLGVEYRLPLHDQFEVAVEANYLSAKNVNLNKWIDEAKKENVSIEASPRLKTLGVLGYYYPLDNGFNINGGVYYNGNKVTFTAEPKEKAVFKIGGQEFRSDTIKDANGSITYRKAAPYIGIGWNTGKGKTEGLAFTANVGGMLHGKPTVDFSAKCAGLFAEEVGKDGCQDLQNKVAKARDEIKNNANKVKFWPVVSVGFVYRF